MNRQTVEYKLYQMILESDLSDEERFALLEANILQKAGDWFSGVSDWFGAAKDWVNSPLGTLFADAKLGRRMQTSIGNVKKEIEQLKKIAKEGGKNEKEVIAAFIKGVLNSENMSTGDLTKSSGGPGPKAKDISAEELPAGTKVTSADPQILLSALTQLLANVTGKPLETVAQQANEKKVNATAMTSVIAKQASQKTGVAANVVQNVVNALIKTGHLVMESFDDLSINVLTEQTASDRLQQLAGLLSEARDPEYSLRYVLKRIESGEIKRVADISKIIAKAKIAALTDDQYEAVIEALKKKRVITPDQAEEATKELDVEMDKLPDQPAPGAEVSPEEEKKAEIALKKFAAAADSVRKEVKDIDDATLGKILNYFDELEDIKIA